MRQGLRINYEPGRSLKSHFISWFHPIDTINFLLMGEYQECIFHRDRFFYCAISYYSVQVVHSICVWYLYLRIGKLYKWREISFFPKCCMQNTFSVTSVQGY